VRKCETKRPVLVGEARPGEGGCPAVPIGPGGRTRRRLPRRDPAAAMSGRILSCPPQQADGGIASPGNWLHDLAYVLECRGECPDREAGASHCTPDRPGTGGGLGPAPSLSRSIRSVLFLDPSRPPPRLGRALGAQRGPLPRGTGEGPGEGLRALAGRGSAPALPRCLLEEMVFLPADSLDRAIPLRLELLRTYFGLSYHDMTGLFSSERLPEVNPLKKSRGGEESDRSFEEAWGTLKNFRRTGMKTKSGDYEESFRIHPTRTEAVVRELEDIFHLPPGWLWSPRGFSYRSGHSSLLDRTISVPSFDDYHDYCRAGWTLLGRVQQRREEEGEDPFPFPIAKPNNRGTLTGNAKAEFDRETKRILCAALPIAEIDDRRARFQFSPEDQAAYLRQEYGIENPSDADLAATWPEVSPDTIYLPRHGPCALVEVIESLNGAKWFPKQGEVTARKVHLDLWDLSVSEYVRSAGFSGYQEMVSILERAIHRALKH